MKYQTYPAYKDSGVEWLGEVPEHWNLKRLKHNLRLLTEKTNRRENPIALENIESWSGRFIQTETIFEGDGVAFDKGDILFGKLRPYLAKAYLVENSGEAVGDFYVMRPAQETLSKFLQYQILTREFIAIVDSSTFGAKMPRVSWDFFGNMYLATPPFPEQQKIAQFLDHETAKIDTLIEKQQRLIELLKEKRQAVISHAVTKGLNPNAPMKDSGVEWLGEVPEHWKIASLSKLFNIKAGGDLKTEFFSEVQTENHPYPIYTNANDEKAVYGYTSKCNYSSNTITVSGRGEVGFAVYRDHAYDAIIRLLVLSATGTSNCKFFTYFINAVIDFRVESSAIGQLSTQQISPYKVTFPSFEEQTKIVNFLDNETVKIDTLIEKSNSAIELMQERRTALISAAVTGKIDVRNWGNL